MIGLTIIQKRPKPRSAKASLRGRNPNGAPVEQGLAAARADSGASPSRSWPSSARSAGRSTCRSPSSRRFPDYAIDSPELGAPVRAGCSSDDGWATSLQNLVVLGDRQRARHRLRLHPRRDDRAREARRGLLPHHLPLSARGLADRHRRRLALDVQPRARRRRTSCTSSAATSVNFNWLAEPEHRDVRHHPRLDLARARLLHGADARRA